jgi:hypothetical protein
LRPKINIFYLLTTKPVKTFYQKNNTRNRAPLTSDTKPADKFSIAIPVVRNAVVDFYKELPTNKE